jgi:hypothetical protein
LLRKSKQSVIYGAPIVYHDTVVVAAEDAAEEAGMYEYEDRFIEKVDEVISNMALSIDPKTTSPGAVMEDFIHNWAQDTKLSPFIELTSALHWWDIAIKKYA